MSYVLSEVLVPENCKKTGPFANSTEASGTPCPAGSTFYNYGTEIDATKGEQTVKICCPQPAKLTPVASLNAPSTPATPLDCVRGTYFTQDSGGAGQCAYCFPVVGGMACPGIPGIGRYAPVPTTPTTPVVTPPLVVVPPKSETPQLTPWAQANWKWLAAIAVVGGGTYLYARKQKALKGLGDYCAEFFSPYEKKWVQGGCADNRKDAEGTARNMQSVGWTTRVTEK